MHLVQLFLPTRDDSGESFPSEWFARIESELTELFGGLTAYERMPATGFWKPEGEKATVDQLVIYEVLTDSLDREWWGNYRQQLEQLFRQESILVRAHQVEVL